MEWHGKSIAFESAVDTTGGVKRPVKVVDLVILTVFGPVSGLRKELIDFNELRQLVRQVGAFFFYDQVVIDGVLYKGKSKLHSVLRKLRQKVLDRHMSHLVRVHGSVDAVNKSLAAVDVGKKSENTKNINDQASELVLLTRAADEPLQDHGWVVDVVAFMKGQHSLLNAKSLRIHPALISMTGIISTSAPSIGSPEVTFDRSLTKQIYKTQKEPTLNWNSRKQ